MDRRRSTFLLAVMLCVVGAASAIGATAAAALSFTPPVDYNVGGKPVDIASVDVNADSRPDLVVAAGDGVSVLTWSGLGRFAPAVHVALEHPPTAIATADLNGDDAVDIVTAGEDDTVTVLLGDGTGSFVEKGAFPTGAMPWDVATGDVTGDGLADVVTADLGGGGVSILGGDGAGGLLAPLDLPTGSGCARVLCADFNLDGTMDLACGRYEWEEYAGFQILLADGAGGFTPMGTYETGYRESGPHGLALGNFNWDAKPDLAVLRGYEGGEIRAFLGDGLGVFLPVSGTVFRGGLDQANGLAVADVNRRNGQDVIASAYRPASSAGAEGPTRIYVLLAGANGGASFRTTSFLARRSVGELVASDFNGDKRPDLAWTTRHSDNVCVRLNGALPALTRVSPAQGRVGTVVTLRGRHFLKQGTSVRFGGVTVTSFVSWSTAAIKVKVPAGAPKGRIAVSVTTVLGRTAPRYFVRL
jgi:hypothetical protein